ncbi:hypothetical protein PoB_006841400 [Plakobranchus ocellatus]|uniref:Uncharacterized protein n=1 Tax=Plakobranchus ocellatus TaxID=259542 RepID=A0AAV4DCN3_9GAST|nr:hypothetical protein PoB_006841400 [Plakobranchus ocellatus]
METRSASQPKREHVRKKIPREKDTDSSDEKLVRLVASTTGRWWVMRSVSWKGKGWVGWGGHLFLDMAPDYHFISHACLDISENREDRRQEQDIQLKALVREAMQIYQPEML